MRKLLLALSLTMAIPCAFAQVGPTWAKDDFSNEEEFTGAYGGVYWYIANEKGSTGTMNRTTNGLEFTFNQPAGTYDGFGVSFGDDNTIDLSGNATIELTVAYLSGNIANMNLRVQLKDIEDRSAEIIIPAGAITWDNRKLQAGFEIAEGTTETYSQSLLGLEIVDTLSAGNGWSCGSALDCPTTLNNFDYTKVTELYFTPLSTEIVSDTPQEFDGTFTVTNFSIGAVGTTPAKPAIEYTASGADLVFTWTETAGASYIFEKGDGNDGWITVEENLSANSYAIALSELNAGDQFRVFTILNGASSAAAYTTVEEVPDPSQELSAPTNVAASAITESSATLTWTAVTGATGYRIEKSDNGNWSAVQTVEETSYGLTGLTANTEYLYRVIALGAAEDESEPTEVSFTTLNPVAIFKSLSGKQLSIFPNPANGLTNVIFDNSGAANVQIKVATMMGTEVASFNASNDRASFDVSGFTKGMYMIHVIADGETIAIDKLIIK